MELTRRGVVGGVAAAAAGLAAEGVRAEPAFPAGAVIRSLLKDHPPGELAGGATLFHEHMSIRDGFMEEWFRHAAETRNAARLPGSSSPLARPAASPTANVLRDEALMTEEMRVARREGVACIVDAGHPDMGRDISFLRRISRSSGLPIVASAGFYAQPFYPEALSRWSEDRVVQEIMKQVLADDIGALGEIGSWDDITADERKVFRAVGRVHRATNLPIFTHTGIPGKSALEQLNILEDQGVDPRRVCIGHLGNLSDPKTEIQRAVLRRGAYVGFDRQGGAGDDPVVAMAMSLIAAGYEEQLLFSSDIASSRELKRFNPDGGGYAKTVTVFAPKLKRAGADDNVVQKILHDNLRRFLAFAPHIRRNR